MKFLHLSDLHIGKSINGFSMLEEQQNAFKQVIEYINLERPDAVVIAGDIYDRTIPGVEAVRTFDNFLTEMSSLEVAVLIISGNHDSPERLNYASRLLTDKKLYIYSAFNGQMQKIIFKDEYGEINFWLLPFIKPSSVRGMTLEIEIESYDDMLKAILENACIDYSKRNVLISHQFYIKNGVNAVRAESELSAIGGIDAIDAGLVEQFDYVAAGHLHCPQSVGSDNIRYSGSPIKYSFSEWRQKKTISLVELKQKGELSILELPILPIHDMREIKGELEALMNDEISSLADKDDYLRVVLTDEDEIIDPMGKLKTVYKNVMSLDFENLRTSIDIGSIIGDAGKVEKLSPYELFSEFFLESQGSTMSEEQAEIVRELL